MKPGPQPKVNQDEAFSYWWNEGEPRTYREVADHYGVSYSTVRHYHDEGDWDGRAEELAAETRRLSDRKVATLIARQRVREVEILLAVQAKFARRLMPEVRDASGATVANPDFLRAGEVTVADFERVAKLLELLNGHATARFGVEGQGGPRPDDMPWQLDSIEEEIIRLELGPGGFDVDPESVLVEDTGGDTPRRRGNHAELHDGCWLGRSPTHRPLSSSPGDPPTSCAPSG